MPEAVDHNVGGDDLREIEPIDIVRQTIQYRLKLSSIGAHNRKGHHEATKIVLPLYLSNAGVKARSNTLAHLSDQAALVLEAPGLSKPEA